MYAFVCNLQIQPFLGSICKLDIIKIVPPMTELSMFLGQSVDPGTTFQKNPNQI